MTDGQKTEVRGRKTDDSCPLVAGRWSPFYVTDSVLRFTWCVVTNRQSEIF